jgi:hypothetical protein
MHLCITHICKIIFVFFLEYFCTLDLDYEELLGTFGLFQHLEIYFSLLPTTLRRE